MNKNIERNGSYYLLFKVQDLSRPKSTEGNWGLLSHQERTARGASIVTGFGLPSTHNKAPVIVMFMTLNPNLKPRVLDRLPWFFAECLHGSLHSSQPVTRAGWRPED